MFRPPHRLELRVLLWLGSIGRHRIVPEPLDHPEHVNWVSGLDDETRRLWNDMVEASLQRETFEPARWEIAVTGVGDAAWQRPTPAVPIGIVVDLLLQPYRILLENNVNDRAFLIALCGSEEARALLYAEQRAWLVFEMGGGSTVVPRVKEVRRSELLRRMVSVLVDSDAMRPPSKDERLEDVQGEQARDVCRAAGDALTGVHLQVLRRRAIENYLPIAALRKWTKGNDNRRRMVLALERLTDAQRHYFNMKGGFNKDTSNAARAGDLHDRLSPSVRAQLQDGFGYDIAKLFARSVRIEDVDSDARSEVRAFVTEVLARMR